MKNEELENRIAKVSGFVKMMDGVEGQQIIYRDVLKRFNEKRRIKIKL